jgi:YHS domain-containing protein
MPGQSNLPAPEPEPEQTLVCGRSMTIPAEYYYPAEYQGRRIYFCTVFCLETFQADPDRFYAAHSRKKDQRK